MRDITPVLNRIYTLIGGKTQVDIANALGVKQSSVSDAKRRGSIPAEWQIKILRKYGINPDWLLTGEGTKFMAPRGEDEIHIVQDMSMLSTSQLLQEVTRRIELQEVYRG